MFGDKYDIENIMSGIIEEIKKGNTTYEEELKSIPDDLKEKFKKMYENEISTQK